MPRAALALLCAALPGGIRAFAPIKADCVVVRPASGSLKGLSIAPLPPMEQEELDRICTCHAAPGAVANVKAWLGSVKELQETPIDCEAAADDASRGTMIAMSVPRAILMLQAPDSTHPVAAAAQGAPPPVFCSDFADIQAWVANHSTPVADDHYVVPVSLQSSTTITLERSPMDTPFVCHKELGQGYLCHETRDAKLYPVVGAEGQPFDVLCHPASAIEDVASLLWKTRPAPRSAAAAERFATGPSTAEDSYCHALGKGSLVWTLAR